jgi:hypothetical protein
MKRQELIAIMAAIIYANSAIDRKPDIAVLKATELLNEAEKAGKAQKKA